MPRLSLDTWLLDRAPKKRDAVLVGVGLFLAYTSISDGGAATWPLVAVGFAVTAAVFGVLSSSTVVSQLGERLRSFGAVVEKAISLTVVFLVAAVLIVAVPDPVGRAATAGSCLFIALALFANAVLAVVGRGASASP